MGKKQPAGLYHHFNCFIFLFAREYRLRREHNVPYQNARTLWKQETSWNEPEASAKQVTSIHGSLTFVENRVQFLHRGRSRPYFGIFPSTNISLISSKPLGQLCLR